LLKKKSQMHRFGAKQKSGRALSSEKKPRWKGEVKVGYKMIAH